MIPVVLAQPRDLCAGVVAGLYRRDVCYAAQNRRLTASDLANCVNPTLVGASNLSKLRGLIDAGPVLASALETETQREIAGVSRFSEITVSILTGVAEDVKFKFPAAVQ